MPAPSLSRSCARRLPIRSAKEDLIKSLSVLARAGVVLVEKD